MKNLKNRISPFEGMSVRPVHLLIWGIPLLVLAIFLNGLISIIFWILLGLLVLGFLIQFPTRFGSPWRKIHFPLMFRYSKAYGFELGRAEKEGRNPDPKNATLQLLKTIYPNKSKESLEIFLNNIEQNKPSKDDIKRVALMIADDNSKNKDIQIIEDKISKFLDENIGENILMVWVIADVVEKIYGVDEKTRYLLAAFKGEAF